MGVLKYNQWRPGANGLRRPGNRDERRGSSLTLSYSQYQSLESTGCVRMLEKSDVILKHPSPFSIESLLGKTGEEGPCVSVSPPALQTPFLFPQPGPHTQVRPLPPHHTNINPDVFSPQNFPFDLLARGLYQNMTGLIGELFDYFLF